MDLADKPMTHAELRRVLDGVRVWLVETDWSTNPTAKTLWEEWIRCAYHLLETTGTPEEDEACTATKAAMDRIRKNQLARMPPDLLSRC